MAQNNRLLLIDANSIVHRAYHALPNLMTSKGAHTGAIYGFLTIFLRIVAELSPTHVAAAFDLKAPTFRHKLYAPYKGTRKPMDAELAEQFEPLKELLALMRVPVVSKEGYEADDILGTLSAHTDDDTVILTGDRDSFQLVSPTTRIYWTKKGVSDVEVIDLARLAADGFTPQSFIDYKALRGDPSDNIPGVPGVGEKTAKLLLEQYKTLDEVLDHASEVKGKLGETLSASREIAELSRTLATIDKDVPLEIDEESLRFSGVYSEDVRRKLQELELNSLAGRMTFASADGTPASGAYEKTVVRLSSCKEIADAAEGDRFAVVIGESVSFAFSEDKEYSVECAQDLFAEGPTFDEALDAVKKLAEGRTLVCYDFKALKKKYGFAPKDFFDVMIAAHLTRGSAPIKSVEAVLGAEGMDVGAAEMLRYARTAGESLAAQGLDKLFYEVEQPLALVLAAMEERGICVDEDRLAALKVKYENILSELTDKIYAAAGTTFNIASPKQLGEVLFDKLGLKHGKKTKTGYSVSEDVLTGLAEAHPVVKYVLEWRHYAKLLGTYVTGMQPLVSRGKIHTEFNQCVTATGRLSSMNPNLQNIPVRGEEAKDVKSAFVASEGCVLVSADYSQIELRMLAHLSGDEKLIEAYNNSEDIHALTASRILGIPQSEVTPAQRRDAKAVNFGIIYGMSDYGLSENISVPVYKAKEFIEKYFATYPKVREYMDANVAFAREHGYSVTMLGRRRNLKDITSSNYLTRSAAERMAMNTPLQGSAADVVKLAMLAVEKRLAGMKSKMILQIHDELIVDAAEDEADEIVRILKEEMENAVKLRVPLIAEANTAKNWGDLK
ncbi:MAG TPA: DNA polymerase I [Candidatus Limadaptatus stercoravium]|nr:DNA polymerase I [Candidatus Limadaptatus stercoravium]